MDDRFGVHRCRLQNDMTYPGKSGRVNVSLNLSPDHNAVQ